MEDRATLMALPVRTDCANGAVMAAKPLLESATRIHTASMRRAAERAAWQLHLWLAVAPSSEWHAIASSSVLCSVLSCWIDELIAARMPTGCGSPLEMQTWMTWDTAGRPIRSSGVGGGGGGKRIGASGASGCPSKPSLGDDELWTLSNSKMLSAVIKTVQHVTRTSKPRDIARFTAFPVGAVK